MDFEFALGFLSIISMFSGGYGLPLGIPPEEDALMAKVAPDECMAYISWAGMAKPDGKSDNSTEAMLAEPEIQRIIAEVDRRLLDALTAGGEDDDSAEALLAKHGASLGRPLLTRPTAIFIEKVEMGAEGPDVRGGALVNLGEDAERVKAELEKLQKQFLGGAVEEVELAGTPAFRLKLDPSAPEINWAIKGSYLIVGIGPESFEGVLARAKTDAPAWLSELRRKSDIRRVSSVIYFNSTDAKAALLPLAGPDADEIRFGLRVLGLDDVQAVSVVAGLDRTGFVSRTHLATAGDAGGLLAFVSDKPLTPLDLESVPADATFAVAVRADAKESYERFKKVVGGFEPRAEEEIEAELRRMEEQTGIKIIDGIFPGVGDVWTVYNSPSEGGLIATGLTASVNVRDYDKLKPEFDKIMKLMHDEFEEQRGFRRGRGIRLKEIKFGEHTIHYLTGEDDLWIAPSFCLTKEHAIFAFYPQNIQAFLSHGGDFKPLATSPHVGPRMKMQGGPSVIVYQDTERLFKLLYPLVPMLGQMAAREFRREGIDFDISLLPSVGSIAPHLKPGLLTIARDRDGLVLESRQSLPGGLSGVATPLMLGMTAPSIKRARLTAKRVQSANNLKQLGLAMHIHHDAHEHFPQAYSVDKEGKPLLSWRVHILPFIEQKALYDQFRLDEPWDSEHNRKLIAKMPEVFRAPTSKAAAGKTVYLGVRGEKSVLSDEKIGKELPKISMAHIRDGTSNTVMIVETSDALAVEWTKPDDFKFDPKKPMAGLIGQHRGGFHAGFCDGSVQFLPAHLEPQTLLNLFNRADGNVVRLRDLGHHHHHDHDHDHGHFEEAPFAKEAIEIVPDEGPRAEEDRGGDEADEDKLEAAPDGDVQGSVTLDGEPLAKAAVKFYWGEEKKPVGIGMTDAGGRYRVRTKSGRGLRPGKYAVTIEKFSEPKRDARNAEEALVRNLAPRRYAAAGTSGLQLNVERGNNTFDVELTSM